jgi:hypothetical protein
MSSIFLSVIAADLGPTKDSLIPGAWGTPKKPRVSARDTLGGATTET